VAKGAGNGQEARYPPIGPRLRAARGARGLSLRTLADKLGVSPSLISQVETGRATPSVNTLYAMANELRVSLDELLFADARFPDGSERAAAMEEPRTDEGATLPIVLPHDPVQPATGRRTIRLASGVVWERLTSASIPNVDFLYVTYEVGGASSPEHDFQRHNGQEWGYIISGTLHVAVGFDEYVLGPGDAVTLDSTVPHRLSNPGPDVVHAIWFVLGRRPGDGPFAERGGAAGAP
jgi:transcriptional regulator with XRE-family HTH domain